MSLSNVTGTFQTCLFIFHFLKLDKKIKMYSYIQEFAAIQALSETASNLYADDTCIYFQHRNVQEIEAILNKEFSSLCEWFIDNKLSIHFGEDKTKSVLFTRSKTPEKLNISFQDHSIRQYNCVEYFGCFLDYNLNGETMARKSLKKINDKLKFLYRQADFLNLSCHVKDYFVMP